MKESCGSPLALPSKFLKSGPHSQQTGYSLGFHLAFGEGRNQSQTLAQKDMCICVYEEDWEWWWWGRGAAGCGSVLSSSPEGGAVL